MMSFWNLAKLPLSEFKPGIMSQAAIGEHLLMAYMEIAPGKEDTGHEHPFDQCGVVVEGKIEMFIGGERKLLGPKEAYFMPAGVRHGWKTFDKPVKVLDITPKPAQK